MNNDTENKEDKIEITLEDLEVEEVKKDVIIIEKDDIKKDTPRLVVTLDDIKEYPPIKEYPLPAPIKKGKVERKFAINQTILYSTLAGFLAGMVAFLANEVLFPHKKDIITTDILKLMAQTSIYFGITGGILGAFLGSLEGVIMNVPQKAKREGIFCLIIGVIGGIIGGTVAQLIYGYYVINYSLSSLSHYLLRGVGWSIIGLFIGISQGMLMPTSKKIRNVVIGGALGGLIGGFLFQMIKDNIQSIVLSRLLSLVIVTSAIGFFISMVEEIAKEVWLKVIKGSLSGKEFIIYEKETIIGSSPDCNIVLFKDALVSPQHCVIKNENNKYIAFDLNSKNGTYVNNQRISNMILQDSDNITIGSTTFRFEEKTSS